MVTPRKAPEAVLVALAEAVDIMDREFPGENTMAVDKTLAAYRAAVAPLRTSDDWRPSNADPVCDPKLAKRETLEALAVALDGTWSKGEPDGGGAVKGALDAYRTECRPAPLRTRAEVDADIAQTVREHHAGNGLGISCVSPERERSLTRLCSEPTADETEIPWDCPNCRRKL